MYIVNIWLQTLHCTSCNTFKGVLSFPSLFVFFGGGCGNFCFVCFKCFYLYLAQVSMNLKIFLFVPSRC